MGVEKYLGVNRTPASRRDFRDLSSRINGDKFIFDSKNFRSDLIFSFRDGKILTSRDGKYVMATIAGTDKKIAIAIQPDASRGASEGDVFEVDPFGFFSSDSKLPNIRIDLVELQQHIRMLQEKKAQATATETWVFAPDPSQEVNPQIQPTPTSLMGNIKGLVSTPPRFMRNSFWFLSGSHGCLHVSPGDADALNSYLSVGTRIKIHPYGEPITIALPPYLEKADFQVNQNEVLVEIYPQPSEKIRGKGIVYYKGKSIGYFIVAGGPETPHIGADGYEATPTKPTDTCISHASWHKSERYQDSLIPGGAQVKIDRSVKTQIKIDGDLVEVPTLYYREFDYNRGVYFEPPRWIRVDKRFMEYLVDIGVLNGAGRYNFDTYPFETRYINGKQVIYYIGSSFGNGEVLATGERTPQITFSWGTTEYIHYGGVEEEDLKKLGEHTKAFMRSDCSSTEEFVTRNCASLKLDVKEWLIDYLKGIESLKGEILKQASALNLTKDEVMKIIELLEDGYKNDGEELFAALVKHKSSSSENFFLSLANLAQKGSLNINGIQVIITDNTDTYRITLSPDDTFSSEEALKRMRLIACRLGQPNAIYKSLKDYEKSIRINKIIRKSFSLGINPKAIPIEVGKN